MERWNAARLLQQSGSYWQACVLHTGVRLGLFDLLEPRGRTVEELSSQLGCSSRGVGLLLDALVAMGLLVKEAGFYQNTEDSHRFLVQSSPDYVGYMIIHHCYLMEGWTRLVDAVKSGQPLKKGPRDEDERRAFILGMHNTARGVAPKVAEAVDLRGSKRLLDLGGGPGTYAIYFCLKNRGLKATVYDLPSTEPFAQQTISSYGLSDRIEFYGGDYLSQELPEGFDVVWVSHIIHSLGPDEVSLVLKKATSSLIPGGLLLIHDFFLEKGGTSPLFPALFSLNMLINTEKGKSYTEEEVFQILQSLGLSEVHRLSFKGPNDSGIISGRLE
ncbi:MAG TPA: methyltransferase domain-containing protein [Desulfobacterales bacterium]|nr:methyltransferase domain-containing protein [Desulfobacterales bacterium]